MGAIEHLTIAVSAEAAAAMRSKVSDGEYGSIDELIEAALLALALDRYEREYPATDDTIKAEVLSAMEEYDRDPSTAFRAEEVRAHLRADAAADEAGR